MQRAERLLDMISESAVAAGAPLRPRTLASSSTSSVRTVYRDIGALVRQGVPVRGEAGSAGLCARCGLRPAAADALARRDRGRASGMRWLSERADPALARAAEDVVSKVAAVLPQHLRPADPARRRAFRRLLSGTLPVDQVDVAAMRAAIRNGRKISIEYSDESGHETQRMIWPIGMTFYERVRIVIAWCELRRGLPAFPHLTASLEPSLRWRSACIRTRALISSAAWQKEEEDPRGMGALQARVRR